MWFKKTCPECNQKVKNIGYNKDYIKFSYSMCENKDCSSYHFMIQYRNGKFEKVLPLKVLQLDKKEAYLFNVNTQDQFWESYE